jgi:hypothetical protein
MRVDPCSQRSITVLTREVLTRKFLVRLLIAVYRVTSFLQRIIGDIFSVDCPHSTVCWTIPRHLWNHGPPSSDRYRGA